jgi:hypothetical protein
MFQKMLPVILFFLLIAPLNFIYSQDAEDEEKIAELKANTRILISEAASMALTLRSPTNRINFSISSADILWDLDETEARGMFSASIEDVKRLMSQVDIETNQQDNSSNTNWAGRRSSNNLGTRTNQAFSLRSALVSAVARHDPDMALRLLQETGQMFTNPQLRKRIEREDKRLEAQIIRQIAARDVTKALELGYEKLSKGITPDVISLLNQIFRKDREKGAEFGKAVLQKLKSTTLNNNNTWLVVSLFQYGLGTAGSDKTPLFDDAGMRDLADILVKQVTSPTSRYRNLSAPVMSGIEKYSPNSVALVTRTFEQRKNGNSTRGNSSGSSSGGTVNSSRKKIFAERTKFQNELAENLKRLTEENLTSEDRQKIINQSKEKILSISSESYRFYNLINLALQSARIGEKEVAATILNEAEYYIKQDPTEKNDFADNQRIADAYALVEVDRSFAIMENMIYRLNGVINGYIKFMEYSGNGRVVENNELVMGSYSRQFTNYLRFSPASLKNLADADFQRVKDLSDKFERPEVRIESRLLIAKTLLASTVPQESKKDKINLGISFFDLDFDITTSKVDDKKVKFWSSISRTY